MTGPCAVCGCSRTDRVRLRDVLCQICTGWFDAITAPRPGDWVDASRVAVGRRLGLRLGLGQ